MSKKIILALSILSISFPLNSQFITSNPIIIKALGMEPHELLLAAIESSSFSWFKEIIEKYYIKKTSLPEPMLQLPVLELISNKTTVKNYNTFPLIKAGITKANEKKLKELHELPIKLLSARKIVQGVFDSTTSSVITLHLAKQLFFKSYNPYDLALTSILSFYCYYQGFETIYSGLTYQETIDNKIKENERIKEYIGSL